VRQTLTSEIWDATLGSLFSAPTMQKGSAYAKSGRVVELTVDESGHTLTGQVVGSGGRRYHTTVNLDGVDAVDDGYLDAFCACPVGYGCKHAAALLVAARDGRRRGAVTASAPDWERLLTPVVRPEAAQAATVPIALQFEVGERDQSSPYTIRRTTTLPSRRVRLRPVVLGSSGRWVRTGVSWSQLRFEQGRSVHRADQVAALREFVLVRDASTRAGYGGYVGYSDALYLDELGPSL
jgi:hypothetical protein